MTLASLHRDLFQSSRGLGVVLGQDLGNVCKVQIRPRQKLVRQVVKAPEILLSRMKEDFQIVNSVSQFSLFHVAVSCEKQSRRKSFLGF